MAGYMPLPPIGRGGYGGEGIPVSHSADLMGRSRSSSRTSSGSSRIRQRLARSYPGDRGEWKS